MRIGGHRNIRSLNRDVTVALNKRLKMADQFNSFVANVVVDAGEEVAVINQLKNKNGARIVPGSWQVIDSRGAGKESLGRGSTEWGEERLYLKNFSSNNGSFSVRFFEKSRDEGGLSQPNSGGGLPSSYTVSEIHLDSPNGHGSTATKIRRYSNIRRNTGSDMTYADSAGDGMTITINTAGAYAFTMSDWTNAAPPVLGISVNASSLTTNINALTYANGKRAYTEGSTNIVTQVAWTGHLSAGDVVRAHTNGGPIDTGDNSIFTAALVWK